MTEKLGSEFCSFEQAASRLNRHKRSVHNYVRDGLIRRKIENGTVVLYRSDVEQLAVDLGADLPPINRKTVFQLMSRVRQLEEKMAAVQVMLDLNFTPFRPNPGEVLSLHQAVTTLLGSKAIPDSIRDSWSELFYRFDEETLTLISKTVTDPKPWKPYFEFCQRMAEDGLRDHRRHTDTKWAAVYRRYEEAVKKLRSVVAVWVEMNQGVATEGSLKALRSEKDDLALRLASK